MMVLEDVRAGFSEPAFAAQTVFRHILDAMARPGHVATLPTAADAPAGLGDAATAVALTLFDFETKVWLDQGGRSPEAERYLRFHCGCPIVDDTADAAFAVVTAPCDMPRVGCFSAGSDQYPDTSATLVIEATDLAKTGPIKFTGPGIKGTSSLGIQGLPDWFWQDWAVNHHAFPLGVDVILTCGAQLMCLPRSTKAEA